jgi:hypothetical protein
MENYGSISEREPEKWLPHPRKAAGVQITQSCCGEVVIINNNTGALVSDNWNEYNLNPLMRNHWRASLVLAAMVNLAPIAYILVVAVKKHIVRPWAGSTGAPFGEH